MITKDDILKAAEHCIACKGVCTENCPLIDEPTACEFILAEYIKENEPALSANSTSSEVSVKEDTDNIHLDDSTKEQICQAYETADQACTNMLTIYEGMSECEQRAFDIGEAYGKIFGTRCKLEELIGANKGGE